MLRLIKETLQIHSILHDETNTPPTHTIRSITAYKYNNLQIHYTHLNKQKLTTHIKKHTHYNRHYMPEHQEDKQTNRSNITFNQHNKSITN